MLKQFLKVSVVVSSALLLAGCEVDNAFLTDSTPYQSNVYTSRQIVNNRTTVVVTKPNHRHYSRPATGYQVPVRGPVSTGYQVPSSGPVSTGYQVPSSGPVSTGYQVPNGDVSTGYQSGDSSESHVTGQYNG